MYQDAGGTRCNGFPVTRQMFTAVWEQRKTHIVKSHLGSSLRQNYICFVFSVCWCYLSLWSSLLFLERKKEKHPKTTNLHDACCYWCPDKNEGTDTQILYSICKHLQLMGWPNVTYHLFFHLTPLFLFFNLIYLSVKVWKFVLSMYFGTSQLYTFVS